MNCIARCRSRFRTGSTHWKWSSDTAQTRCVTRWWRGRPRAPTSSWIAVTSTRRLDKLWNVARLTLANLDGTPPTLDTIDENQFELADRWILSRLQGATKTVTEHLDAFRLNEAAAAVYHFLWDELADWYVEQVKPRLHGKAPGGEVARATLIVALEGTLRLLHPFMPFISEELWGYLPGERKTLLARASWPAVRTGLVDAESEQRFELVKSLVSAIRTIRAEYGVKPGKVIRASTEPASDIARQAFEAELSTITRLCKIADLAFESPDDAVGAHAVLPDGSAVFVPLGDAIDVPSECERLGTEMERLDQQLRAATAKLANENFTTRAPADVVERERQKEQAWREQHDTLAAKRRSLGC